jgi:hypothetical protein
MMVTDMNYAATDIDIRFGGAGRKIGGCHQFTPVYPHEEFISTGTIVVSNGLLHDQMLRVLREGDAAPLPQ